MRFWISSVCRTWVTLLLLWEVRAFYTLVRRRSPRDREWTVLPNMSHPSLSLGNEAQNPPMLNYVGCAYVTWLTCVYSGIQRNRVNFWRDTIKYRDAPTLTSPLDQCRVLRTVSLREWSTWSGTGASWRQHQSARVWVIRSYSPAVPLWCRLRDSPSAAMWECLLQNHSAGLILLGWPMKLTETLLF